MVQGKAKQFRADPLPARRRRDAQFKDLRLIGREPAAQHPENLPGSPAAGNKLKGAGLRQFIKRNFLDVFGNYRKVKQGKTYTVALAERA